jgi:hypothetical protein
MRPRTAFLLVGLVGMLDGSPITASSLQEERQQAAIDQASIHGGDQGTTGQWKPRRLKVGNGSKQIGTEKGKMNSEDSKQGKHKGIKSQKDVFEIASKKKKTMDGNTAKQKVGKGGHTDAISSLKGSPEGMSKLSRLFNAWNVLLLALSCSMLSETSGIKCRLRRTRHLQKSSQQECERRRK